MGSIQSKVYSTGRTSGFVDSLCFLFPKREVSSGIYRKRVKRVGLVKRLRRRGVSSL